MPECSSIQSRSFFLDLDPYSILRPQISIGRTPPFPSVSTQLERPLDRSQGSCTAEELVLKTWKEGPSSTGHGCDPPLRSLAVDVGVVLRSSTIVSSKQVGSEEGRRAEPMGDRIARASSVAVPRITTRRCVVRVDVSHAPESRTRMRVRWKVDRPRRCGRGLRREGSTHDLSSCDIVARFGLANACFTLGWFAVPLDDARWWTCTHPSMTVAGRLSTCGMQAPSVAAIHRHALPLLLLLLQAPWTGGRPPSCVARPPSCRSHFFRTTPQLRMHAQLHVRLPPPRVCLVSLQTCHARVSSTSTRRHHRILRRR